MYNLDEDENQGKGQDGGNDFDGGDDDGGDEEENLDSWELEADLEE